MRSVLNVFKRRENSIVARSNLQIRFVRILAYNVYISYLTNSTISVHTLFYIHFNADKIATIRTKFSIEPNLFSLTFCNCKKSFKNELADCKIPSRERCNVDFDTCMRDT